MTNVGTKDAKGEDNTLGFVAQSPLFVGEGMHIIISLPKTDLLPPDWGKRFSWFITDYGDILFALFGLAAILVSYIISWQYISAGRSKLKIGMHRTAPMLRYLIKGKFDKVSFVAYLLELFRKNIIDIQESDGEVMLIKKTYDFSQIFAVELAGSITLAFYVWILKLKFQRAVIGWISKIFALLIILFTLMVLSVYIHPVAALLLLTMIYIIFAYTRIFAKRSGLMKNNIKDVLSFRDYLIDNAATLSLGRGFAAQQANIFALDVSGKYPEKPNIRDAYRLETAAKLVQKL